MSVTSLPPSSGPVIPESVEPIDDFYRRLMRERWFPVAVLLIAFLVLVILSNQFDADRPHRARARSPRC